MRHTLITGAAGFIGSHLARRCLDDGDVVDVLLRPHTETWRLRDLSGRIRIHRLDLRDRSALAQCLAAARPDRLFHLAWDVNHRATPISGTARDHSLQDVFNLLALLEASAESRHRPGIIVRAGSIAEYGAAAPPCHEHQHERPQSPYAAALVAATRQSEMLAPLLPFRLVTGRLALIHGRDQSEAFLIPSLLRHCIDSRPIHLRRPDDRRDLVHVSDAVEALCRLSEQSAAGPAIVNIASGQAPTVADVAALAVAVTGADPALISRGDAGEPTSVCASGALAQSTIGWAPRIGLREGMADTVAAMRNHRLEAVAS
ncbi:NAD-dependent epimerase/dehydratase family protein [Sphingomonas sp. KC8]|uniref:NAD-dependent epimerase/dehydratase family protein n=1 Tax=Sphingomonas sp. KC8 TaxID=1030157 RepID=UPI000248988E|nr:NAD(P)-dependent oxidoreductase [Sphingomonas sp. KC8]ARS27247.1 hypothetical protein KC8_08075 [Sphingomonas sp. KC8]